MHWREPYEPSTVAPMPLRVDAARLSLPSMLARVTVALLLSSAVMFALEPMLAKMMLPGAGGGPSVWTACLVFFQCALLLGYVASHALLRRFGPRRQALIVCAVLAMGLFWLPVRLPDRAASSSFAVLSILCLAAGAPFVALSMIAPSLQRWYHEVAPTREPYVLFAMSNVGCLAALVAYPVVEPYVGLHAQSRIAAVAYVALILSVVAAAVGVWRAAPAPIAVEVHVPVPRSHAARWVLLAFVPSAYLAAVTTHVTTEVAPIPLLWTIPLALYITTFIVAFGGPTRAGALAARVLPLFSACVVFVVIAQIRTPAFLIAAIHVATFFVSALASHSELARLRPPAPQLTTYYVWIALGGAAGSIFVALVAPLLFDQYLEYPLLILFALTVCPPSSARVSTMRADVLFAIAVAVVAMVTMTVARSRTGAFAFVVFPGVALAVALVALGRPRRFALSIALVLGIAGAYAETERTLWRERNFFGTLRVSRDATNSFVVLTNGTTVHGKQRTDPARRDEPLAYYARTGPAQDVFSLARRRHETDDVIVVGLGAGTLAAYAQPQERWTFIEIDPAVISVAKNPRLFTFLSDAFPKGDYTILEGDARVVLERQHGRAGLLVMDAFASDAIPTHLLTVEAGRLYATKARLVALHVSNRHARLSPVVARLARDIGWVAAERDDLVMTDRDERDGKTPSQWILLAPSRDAIDGLADTWEVLDADDRRAWTDDATSVLGILR